jgi:hypothetical protein
MAASNQRRRRIVFVHKRLHEYQSFVRRIQNALKFLYCCDRKTFGRAFAAENGSQLGVRQFATSLYRAFLPRIAPLDRVTAVVDEKDERLDIMAQNGGQLLRGQLKRAVTDKRCAGVRERRIRRRAEPPHGIADAAPYGLRENEQPAGSLISVAPELDVPSSARMTSPGRRNFSRAFQWCACVSDS